MNCSPLVMHAKIILRNAGWEWNRKLRCWEITVGEISLSVPQTLDALRVQRGIERGELKITQEVE